MKNHLSKKVWIFLLSVLASGMMSCSDPVSSEKLTSSEISFEGKLVPQWGDYYELEVRLTPKRNEYDYVLLNSTDTFYVVQDDLKKRLNNQGSIYSANFSATSDTPIDVVLYLSKADQHLHSVVQIPQRIHSTDLSVSIDYFAKYSWNPENSDKFEVNWFAECETDSARLSESYEQVAIEAQGVAEWDMNAFLGQAAFKNGAYCKLSVKAIRSAWGEIDFNFAAGELVAEQIDERAFSFTLK